MIKPIWGDTLARAGAVFVSWCTAFDEGMVVVHSVNIAN